VTTVPEPSRGARSRARSAVLALLVAACAGCGQGLVPAGGTDLGPWLALAMVDATHGWGVTTHDVVRTDDGGAHWTGVAKPPIPPASLDVRAFTASGTVAWLCEQGAARGSSPVTNPEGDPRNARSGLARCTVSADGGRTWASPHDVPGTASTYTSRTRIDSTVMSLSARDQQQAWAVVRTTRSFAGGGHESFDLEGITVIQTVDGGATWTVLRRRAPASDGSPDSPAGVQWVRFTDALTGWMAGYLPDTMEVSHDGGLTWRPAGLPLPARNEQADLVELAPLPRVGGGELLEPVVVGSIRTSFRGTFLASPDGGRTWTSTVSPPVAVGSVPAVDVLDGRQWWLLARRTLLATSDAGLHWATFEASAPVPDLTAVQMLSSRAGLAIGFDQRCALDRARADSSACRPLLRTRDGGHTWVAAL